MMSTAPNTDRAVDEYIARYPEEVQGRLEQIRALIRRIAPDAQELVSYAIPAYKLNGKPLIYFAGYAKHIGVYPLPDDPSPELEADMKPHIAGKGTLRFPNSDPLPVDLIRRVIENRLDSIAPRP